ncbi:MAG: 2-oxo acid dehydrogenase subunit E2 [Candidatus Tectomicrobia bacterium]|nr:2-oxo acid dehydrogenase subunit E2 [Candidatus Tectomicrobia bacterium]
MATFVLMPKLGQEMTEGTLLCWLKQEGEDVVKGEPIAEIETPKVTAEVEAPADGVLLKHLVPEGATVPCQEAIAVIGAAAEDIPPLPPKFPTAPASAAQEVPAPATPFTPGADHAEAELSAAGSDGRAGRPQRAGEEGGRSVPAPVPEAGGSKFGYVPASPLAKRLAREHGIELRGVRGSGSAGSVRARDLQPLIAASRRLAPLDVPPGAAPLPQRGIVIPHSSMRRRIAERVLQSTQRLPHFFISLDIDMGEALKLRAGAAPRLAQQVGVEVTINDLLVKAAALALRQHPLLNSSWTDEGIRVHAEINIGVVVALEEGLIVPVVRRADEKPLAQVCRELRTLSTRARDGSLRRQETSGGTFSISNLGMHHIDRFTAIINEPESAVLAVGSIAERAVAREGQLLVRPMMTATLSCDHRVIDGVVGSAFLNRLREILESPNLLLVEEPERH